MSRLIAFLTFTSLHIFGISQITEHVLFDSKTLGEQRKIRIHLPEIKQDTSIKLPLIITLDGEYMFYNIVAAMELLSITESMPKAVVVGIDQNYTSKNSERYQRWIDCDYNGKTGEIEGTGVAFKTFLEDELIPYLKNTYSIGNYAALVGHSFTANYLLYFLKEKNSSFTGYLSVSPYIADSLVRKLSDNLNHLTDQRYLYISTSTDDLRMHKALLEKYDTTIFQTIQNTAFNYHFDLFKEETHMTLTYPSALSGLKFLFEDYSPLYKLNELEIAGVEDYVQFLKNRYADIQHIYDIPLPIREVDITEMSWVAIENEKWEQLLALSEWHIQLYPESYGGYYSLGSYYEAKKDYSLALVSYEKGYSLLGSEVSNKSDFYEDIDRIKKLMK